MPNIQEVTAASDESMSYRIRKADNRDSGSTSDVFNHFVENSYASYEISRIWLDLCFKIRTGSPQCPFYVIEASNKVIGFGFLPS